MQQPPPMGPATIRYFVAILVLFVLSTFYAVSVRATLYTQPSNYPAGGSFTSTNITGKHVYDNFTLVSSGTVNEISWQGVTNGTANFFDINIYANAGGVPGSLLYTNNITKNPNNPAYKGAYFDATTIAPGIVNYTAKNTGVGTPTRPYLSIPLNAGTQYWISIFNTSLSSGSDWQWHTGSGGDAQAYSQLFTNPITALNADMAFSLVPEPGTLCLTTIGALGLLAMVVRRRAG